MRSEKTKPKSDLPVGGFLSHVIVAKDFNWDWGFTSWKLYMNIDITVGQRNLPKHRSVGIYMLLFRLLMNSFKVPTFSTA